MINLNVEYPVPSNKTWNILDSSKYKDFISCERYYFYRHVLGWRPDYPPHDLVFGESWHRGMKVLFDEGYNKPAIEHAVQAFMDYYRQYFNEVTDLDYVPKSPGDALNGFISYVSQYQHQDKWEVLFTERAGTVLIEEDVPLHFRLDAVVRNGNRIICIDHKTTRWASNTWAEQFNLDFQMHCYHHVLHCMYPNENIGGILINGTKFFKSKIEHERVPIHKSLDSLNLWYHEARLYASEIKRNFALLSNQSEHDPVLTAFPRRLTQCVRFNRMCSYTDFCSVWANPLKHAHAVPADFKVEWWDPSEREKETITL
jgi:hypothetical protein